MHRDHFSLGDVLDISNYFRKKKFMNLYYISILQKGNEISWVGDFQKNAVIDRAILFIYILCRISRKPMCFQILDMTWSIYIAQFSDIAIQDWSNLEILRRFVSKKSRKMQ